jgi:hypothetical protein
MVDWTTVVTYVIIAIITAYLAPAIKKGIVAGFEWLKSKTSNGTLLAAYDVAQQIASATVEAMEQTTVGALRKDGTLKDKFESVKADAVNMFLHDMPDTYLEIIKKNVGDINIFAGNQIESALNTAKANGVVPYSEEE